MNIKLVHRLITFKKTKGVEILSREPYLVDVFIDKSPAIKVIDGDTLELATNIEVTFWQIVTALFTRKILIAEDIKKLK